MDWQVLECVSAHGERRWEGGQYIIDQILALLGVVQFTCRVIGKALGGWKLNILAANSEINEVQRGKETFTVVGSSRDGYSSWKATTVCKPHAKSADPAHYGNTRLACASHLSLTRSAFFKYIHH
jgi:hypothetical protein